jgi:O-acetyl-ADP-ribose deacetylase (regulator of RNase III)
MRIQLVEADITTLEVDAIVNAANVTLLGGGGVDGAIHRAAGPQLLKACESLREIEPGVRCPTGEARLTPGYRLPARFVIHTVGPVWRGGHDGEARLLASCYRECLAIAQRENLATIAFPAISCGLYGYPIDDACDIAVSTVLRETPHFPSVQFVFFCAFSERVIEGLQNAIAGVDDQDESVA